MRKLVYLFALFCTSFYYAQTNGITYQAVIYIPNGQNIPGQDIQNSPMTNRSICLQFSLIDDASQIEYQETIQTTTDDFGMVNLIIGTGTQTGGYASSFNGVIWNNTQKTLKVELDARGTCQDYIILSDNPLSAVPFAYAAVTANNVSGTVAVFNGGTGANNPTDARINLGLGNVDNTSDAAKPISTATQAALDTKEALSNKSTAPTLGTSDVLYPTQNAVKTYVDAQVASATIADADAVTKGKIQLAGDLSGTAAAPTVPALATKENIANKSTNTTLGTSDVLFPTQNAVKTYVDAQVASATIADADAVTKGKIQLAGDLSGTAAAPTVPALATKENIANKSTATTLGTSDQLFPTQNAVKTYVDTNITSVNSTITTLQGTVTANANAATTAIAAVQADVDANETAANTALALKEDAANKSTATTLGTSDQLFPTQNAVKTYVDAQVASATIADADAVTKGKIQLAGDLSGTAAAPTVPALVLKEDTANKSTATTLGTSDQLFPTQNAVKTYVDTNITSVNSTITTLQGTVTANANAATTAIAAVQADVDANETAANTALALKENSANKTLDLTTVDGTSDIKFPSAKATKDYVDSQIATGVVDASTTIKGKVQLAGDLTGTAALPEVAAGAITTAKLADDAVTTIKITDANVTTNKLAANAVTSAKILDGTILVGDLADDAVETAKIKDANVTSAKLADNAVETAKIKNANVTNAKLDKANIPLSGFGAATADVDLGSNKLTNVTDPASAQDAATKNYVDTATSSITTLTDGKIYVGNASNEATQVTPTGDVTITNAGVTAIGTGKVVTAMLADTAVTTAKITDANVTTAKLANDAVETAKIKNANVTNAKLDKANIPLSGFGAATADVDLGSNKLTNVTDPASAQDAATKNYVDTATSSITTLTDGKIYVGNASNEATQVTPTGDVTITNAGVTAIGTGKVVTAMLADTAVTTAKITDANVTTAKLANDAVETAKIKNANVTNAKLDKANIPLSGFGAATADVDLGSNKLTNVTDPASAQDAATKNYVDTATSSITTLTDGKIYVGNASNEATQVTPTGDVTITNAGVTAIGTGKVVTAMLATDAVETAKIKDANVTTAKLANDAVETAKIKNANVTNAKLDKANIPLSGFGAATADVDLGSNKLTNVTDPASAQDAATKNYVDTATSNITTLTDGKIYVGNASNEATQVTPTGDVTITNAGVTAIGTGKVVTAMLADTAVTTAKITDANVTTAKLADNAVETAKIKNANVTNAKLDKANIPLSGFGAATADVDLGSNKLTNVTDPASAQDAATKNYVDTATSSITTLTDGKIYVGNASNEATQVTPTGDVTITNAGVTAIGTGKVVTAMLADTAVTTAKITDANVTTAKLADNAVETAKINNAAVTTAKIADANVTYAKIQNVSATDKVLGRVSTGAGVIEEIATTGTGNVVRATSPTLVTPNLGTPSAIDLTNATGLPIATAVTGILDVANGGTGSATQNFVDLTTNQTIAGVKTFSGTSTVVNQNLTVNAAGTTGQGIILSDDGDIVDNNDGAATFRFTGGVKINNGNKSAGTTTNITLSNTGNITASGSVTASQITSNVATGTAPLVVTSTTPVANLNIGGNAANVTGTVAIANGGTGQTTKAAAFNALSPMTTAGDIIYGGTSGTGTRLAAGSNGQVLTLASGVPSWVTPSGITTLAAIGSTANANGATISGSTLNLEPASANFGGIVTTGTQVFAGAKTFNSDLKVNNLTVGKGAANNTTLFGFEAGAALTSSGTNNVAVGYQALKATTGGTDNVAVGNIAGTSLTTGTGNIAIGSQAMRYTTTGHSNTAIGYGALNAVTTANSNIGIGSSSGSRITTGENNIHIGSSAGTYIGTGTVPNTTGSNSILIGANTRPAADNETNEIVIAGGPDGTTTVGLGSNSTLIGSSATTRAVIYGSTSLSNLPATAASGAAGGNFTLTAQNANGTNTKGGDIILTPGTATGTGAAGIVKVNGQIQITGGNPGAGEVLVSDANGLATWSNAIGSTVVTNSTTYAITTAEAFVFYNGSANAAFTIPAASSTNQGKAITIKNKTGFGITITPASGTIYIDSANTGAANVSIGIEASNNWIKLVSDGTQWNVLRALF